VCLSIFRQKFTKSWPCAHRLADIAHYYGQHYQLMQRWLSLYPGHIYELAYDDLIEDLPGEVERLLLRVGLEMEPACLLPHRNRRQVATFSAVQVQKPVSKSYSTRAKEYREWLAEAEQELIRAGVLHQSQQAVSR
jgi:hypothetical protein